MIKNKISQNEDRIVWLDYVRTFLIVLVVVGHATGLFNGYIYQFHVAAFFLFSGYLNNDNKSSVHKLYNRFMALIVPVIILFLIYLALMKVLDIFGYYSVLFGCDYYGTGFILKSYFFNGQQYINLLGATWFLPVLFIINVVHEIVRKINYTNNTNVKLFFAFLIYFLGFYLSSRGVAWRDIDISLISFGFFEIGVVAKETDFFNNFKKLHNNLIIFICSIIVMYVFAVKIPGTMDISSRTFPNEIFPIITTLNGAVLLVAVSNLLCGRSDLLDRVAVHISKNTLGILFFHFSVFKICYVLLYKFGLISFEEIGLLTPTWDTGRRFWFFLTITALLTSIIAWIILNKIPLIKTILGQDKNFNEKFYNYLIETKICKKLKYFYIKSISRLNIKLKNTISNKQELVCLVTFFVLVIAFAIPVVQSGICCNDEVQSRFWGMMGFKSLFEHYSVVSIQQGRILSIVPVCLEFFLQFMSSNKMWEGIVSVSILLLDAVLIVKVLKLLFDDKVLNTLYLLLFLCCLPITFEHTLPNAFVAFLGVPVALFLSSVLLSIRYYEIGKNRYLIVSMIILFISLSSYEGMITLMPLYVAVVWHYSKNENRILNGMIKKLIIPFLTSVAYLGLYLILGNIFQTNYDGNKLVFESFRQSATIVINLILSAIPGYYSIISPKYRYLYGIYAENMESTFLGKIINWMSDVRVVILCIAVIIILSIVLTASGIYKQKSNAIYKMVTPLIAVIFMIFPTLPIALSKMYQNNVGEHSGFTALPTTYLVYLFVIFIFSYIIREICLNNGVMVKSILLVMIVMLIASIQYSNSVYAKCHENNNRRLQNIEMLCNTEFINYFSGRYLLADDLYETRNILAYHAGYWTQYFNVHGRNVVLESEWNENITANVDMQGNDIFIVSYKQLYWIISPKQILTDVYIELDNNQIVLVQPTNDVMDNGMHIYTYLCKEGEMQKLKYSDAIDALLNDE